MTKWKRSIAIGALALAAGAGFFGFNAFESWQFARAEAQVEATREQLAQVESLADVFRDVGKVIQPSVVNIDVKKSSPGGRQLPFDLDQLRPFLPDRDGDGQPDLPEGFGEGDGGPEQFGTGSGVIMEVNGSTGYIVTNNHVAGGATEMEITLSDGRVIKNGKVLGTDAKTDMAVIQIDADRLIAAQWGNSDELQEGDWILAFGSPFGYVGSMTHGIVSALNRDVGILRSQQGYENFIQVDAPINPGNSGGPLVSVRGEVVGINTAIASRSGGWQGIGFAVPSNQAKFVYQSLKDQGRVVRGWLGVEIASVDDLPEEARAIGYEGEHGVIVKSTFNNTPAFGKLQPSDIVTKLNGRDLKDVRELRNAVAATAPGTDISLTVFRDGKEQDVKITIGEQPDDLMAAARGGRGTQPKTAEASVESLGIRLSTLNDELAKKYELSHVESGAVVTQVAPNSIAARAGLETGAVITKVDGKSVSNADEATAAISKGDLKKGIGLFVTSKDASRFVFVRSGE